MSDLFQQNDLHSVNLSTNALIELDNEQSYILCQKSRQAFQLRQRTQMTAIQHWGHVVVQRAVAPMEDMFADLPEQPMVDSAHKTVKTDLLGCPNVPGKNGSQGLLLFFVQPELLRYLFCLYLWFLPVCGQPHMLFAQP